MQLDEHVGPLACLVQWQRLRVLIGDVSAQCERLGHVRRHALHLRRQFTPTRIALHRALQQGADARGGMDAIAWRAVLDAFAFAIDEASAVHERAKILQEELASRLAEATSRNLYILTICTIVFLPMTLLTGVFGMNIAGVPGVGSTPRRPRSGGSWD
jgi:zinc transporter